MDLHMFDYLALLEWIMTVIYYLQFQKKSRHTDCGYEEEERVTVQGSKTDKEAQGSNEANVGRCWKDN